MGGLDCYCPKNAPLTCAVCRVRMAMSRRRKHQTTLSVSMLRRRLPDLDGETAMVLLEATKWADTAYVTQAG